MRARQSPPRLPYSQSTTLRTVHQPTHQRTLGSGWVRVALCPTRAGLGLRVGSGCYSCPRSEPAIRPTSICLYPAESAGARQSRAAIRLQRVCAWAVLCPGERSINVGAWIRALPSRSELAVRLQIEPGLRSPSRVGGRSAGRAKPVRIGCSARYARAPPQLCPRRSRQSQPAYPLHTCRR